MAKKKEDGPTESDYRHIALQMALRHPDVMKMIDNPNDYQATEKRYLSEQEAKYLYENFGLSTNSISTYEDSTGSDIYDMAQATICHLPIKQNIGSFEFTTFKESNILAWVAPKKLTVTGTSKCGVLIKTILKKDDGYTLFDWYDAIYGISEKTLYSLDPSKEKQSNAKKNCKILKHWIDNKRWFELIP